MDKFSSFSKAIADINFRPEELELEHLHAGANNNVIGLKYKDAYAPTAVLLCILQPYLMASALFAIMLL